MILNALRQTGRGFVLLLPWLVGFAILAVVGSLLLIALAAADPIWTGVAAIVALIVFAAYLRGRWEKDYKSS